MPINPLDVPVGNIPNPMDEIQQASIDNQAAMGLPTMGTPTPELDLSNQVYPLPPEPATIGQGPGVAQEVPTDEVKSPADALKDAAAAHVLGVDAPAPQMVDEKVGKQTTETDKVLQSADSKAAEADIAQADKDAKAASQAEIDSVGKQAEVEASRREADTKAIMEVEASRAAVRGAKTNEIQQTLADIDSKVAELSNYKPETFWGSKSTSDKIAASISVGLGSFAQSLTGSGQNVGSMLLNRQMDEFDNNQKAVYMNKIEQIKQMRTGVDEKEKLIDQMDKTFDAQKLAARAQVANQYARAAVMAKTPQVQAAIAKAQATFDQNNAKLHAEIADKYTTKIKSTEERDIIKQVQRTPGMGPDGKPLKLTEANSKARIAYADIAAANASIKGMDLGKISQTPAFQTYLASKNNEMTLDGIPFVGKAITGIGNQISGTNDEYLAAHDPVAAQAANAMDSWTRGVIRYKSGAAIAHQEQNEERNQYWPALGDTPDRLKEKAEARANIEKAMRQAGAME